MKNSTIVIVKELPKCDFCDRKASYDAKTIFSGSWANMCGLHYKVNALHKTLGLGKGQKYVFEQTN